MAEDAITILASGATITTGASSSRVAIPNTTAGSAPKYVRIVCTGQAFVKIGDSSVTAASGDMLIQNADGVVVRCHGCTHVAAIQVAAASTVQISPLEDQ